MVRKTCYYELLGVASNAETAEIKKAYRTAALRWHPDRNFDNQEEATVMFKQVQEAYEVLQDANERAWYDGHKEAILTGVSTQGGDVGGQGGDASELGIDLFAFFSTSVFSGFSDDKGGFFAVFEGVFNKIFEAEPQDADTREIFRTLGSSTADYSVVRAFYSYWCNFGSKRTFAFKDLWRLQEAPDRRARRLMEKENLKARADARKEHNKTVQRLAEFVKKRDPRVIKETESRAEREMESEREKEKVKQEAAALRAVQRQEHMEQELLRMAEQAKVAKLKYGRSVEEDDVGGEEDLVYFECGVCQKSFKSEKAFQNHELSKKHKQAVAALQYELAADDALAASQLETLAIDGEAEEEHGEECDDAADRVGGRPAEKKNKKKKNKNKKQQCEEVEEEINSEEDFIKKEGEEGDEDEDAELLLMTAKQRKAELKRRKFLLWDQQQAEQEEGKDNDAAVVDDAEDEEEVIKEEESHGNNQKKKKKNKNRNL